MPMKIPMVVEEHHPTPSLDTTRDFVHRFRAIHSTSARDHSAGCASGAAAATSKDILHDSIVQLTTAVASLTSNKKQLQAAMEV